MAFLGIDILYQVHVAAQSFFKAGPSRECELCGGRQSRTFGMSESELLCHHHKQKRYCISSLGTSSTCSQHKMPSSLNEQRWVEERREELSTQHIPRLNHYVMTATEQSSSLLGREKQEELQEFPTVNSELLAWMENRSSIQSAFWSHVSQQSRNSTWQSCPRWQVLSFAIQQRKVSRNKV